MSDIVKRIAGIINDHEKAIFDHSNGSFQCALVIIGAVNEQYTRTDTIPQWQPIETVPNDRMVWIMDKRRSDEPILEHADGDFWRAEKARGYEVPSCWMEQIIPTPPKETT